MTCSPKRVAFATRPLQLQPVVHFHSSTARPLVLVANHRPPPTTPSLLRPRSVSLRSDLHAAAAARRHPGLPVLRHYLRIQQTFRNFTCSLVCACVPRPDPSICGTTRRRDLLGRRSTIARRLTFSRTSPRRCDPIHPRVHHYRTLELPRTWQSSPLRALSFIPLELALN